MTDSMTVLTSSDNERMAKLWRIDGEIEGYDKGMYFEYKYRKIDSFETMVKELRRLERLPNSFVVRDKYNGEHKSRIRRKKKNFKPVYHNWLLIDCDKYEYPEGLSLEEAAQHFIEHELPDIFCLASYYCCLSNSQGHVSKPGLNCHLWFWLKNPMHNGQILAMFDKHETHNIDRTLYRPIQVHYTSNPVFDEGVQDPVEVRSWVHEGLWDDVENDEFYDVEIDDYTTKEYTEGDAENDRIFKLLKEKSMVINKNNNGGYNVKCPRNDHHTTKSSDSSTTYYPGDGDDYGVFNCLHDSCGVANKDQTLYHEALDFEAANIAAFPMIVDENGNKPIKYKVVPGKGRYSKHNVSNISQVVKCIRDDQSFPYTLVWDEFTVSIMLAEKDSPDFRVLNDNDYGWIQAWFDDNKWEPVPTWMIRQAVWMAADKNIVNSARDWANSLEWDGIDRYGEFLKQMGAVNSEYYQAVIRYLWTSHAARAIKPGYQADAIVVLVSEKQGTGKSQLINALAPKICGVSTYRNIDIDHLLDSDSAARTLKGCLVANMDEMRNFTKREQAGIKAALSRMTEGWTPKYKECFVEFGRSCVLYATNNQIKFLDDETGERRYHPIVVGDDINLEWVKENAEQLWAQGITDFKENGQAWKDALNLAPEAIAAHKSDHPWEEPIFNYLENCVGNVTTTEILTNVINKPIGSQHRGDQTTVGKIMVKTGWIKRQINRKWVFCPPE